MDPRQARGRPLVTIHLPMPVPEVGKLGKALERIWPGSVLVPSEDGTDMYVYPKERE